MLIRPRKPATLALIIAVGRVAAPVEEDGTAEALGEDVVRVDDAVLADLPVEVEVELLYLPVTEAVVLPEEPVVRGTFVVVMPALQSNQPIV